MPSHIHRAGRGLRHALTLTAMVAALSGCAAQMAFREGKDLVAKDQVEAGLLKLKEAVAKEPGNAEYRAAYLQARDRASIRLLQQADADMAAGRNELAMQNLQRVLALDPQNERARAGYRTLETNERHGKALAAAAELLARKDYDLAKSRVNAILTEKPDHVQARALLREINEKSPPVQNEGALAKAYKQPITVEFKDAPLKQVFDVISRRSGLNFVFDKDVKTDTRTSIFLRNSTVESAVYYLLMSNQLEQQVMDQNTVLIYPNIAAKLREYQETVIKTFYLANAEAKNVANTLKTILKSRDVVADEKLNLVIMRDNADAVRMAEKLVALQDMPEPEVMLEVEILEIKRSRLMELGVEWPAGVTLAPVTRSNGTSLHLSDLDTLNRSTIAISSLSTTINANVTDGDSKLLANPRIRVRNKEKAKVQIGDKVPVITTTVSPGGTAGFSQESVNYVDVGLTLNAEPTIYLNNEVGIRIALEVSNLVSRIETKTGSTAYQIGTRQATTMLQLKDGENQVLAGLINNTDRSSGNKIPGLGELPILGRLFGNSTDESQQTEIVLSITPHLIRNLQRPEASASEFSAGTEANFRRKPDVSVRTTVTVPGRNTNVPQGAPEAQPSAVPQPPALNAPPPPASNVSMSSTQPGPASSVSLPAPPPPPQTVQPAQPAPAPSNVPPPAQQQ
ncbi:secretin N-terminal domain-containing protein [Massilia endophytica]|uniref:secretin N-terminal domain-containing protein n=1 Tax=Massilia endophytica TaxID=2899220 RepID=UPI001E2BFBE7|nr:secretin N-terminal domain-containing protein [Massilia endophytica]UGQ47667.1 general secretion pathway protein GspD [Massilia endophytica]